MKIPPNMTGITIGQEIQAITAIKIKAKGISINVVMVAEVMKSRTVSNDLKLEANEPTDKGRFSSLTPSTRSIMRDDNFRSTRWLAHTRKYPRRVRRTQTRLQTSDALGVHIHSVSTD